MFYNCSSLISLPDISKWDVTNVKDMSKMFENCSSLLSLPKISKWDTFNVTNMKKMFYNCLSLTSFPNLFLWNPNRLQMAIKSLNTPFWLPVPFLSSKFLFNNNYNNYMNKLKKKKVFYEKKQENPFQNLTPFGNPNPFQLFPQKSLLDDEDIDDPEVEKKADITQIFENCISTIYMPNIKKLG